jgi:mannose-6-phosphate isomerase-like protein (cupin superfamily)
MTVEKQHIEFQAVDIDGGDWQSPPGYPPGIEQKVLAGRLDEASRTGNRTRLLRFLPGAFTTTPFVHDYWEEVYVLSGDLQVGDGGQQSGVQTFGPNTYACRPPGSPHGPFRSETGCLLFEIHYFAPPEAPASQDIG